MKIFIRALAFICILPFLSCEDESTDFCLSNQQSVQAGLYSAFYTDDVDTTVSGLTLYGIGAESNYYDSVTVNEIYLPLNMQGDSDLDSDTTQFVIEINKLKDTISFVHQKELNFISGECGYVFSFYLDTVYYSKKRFIDTVIVDYDEVIYNENLENVKIYLYN